MKLLRMTACFGTLQHQELILQEGLNLLSYPNESGKTTWAAFLLAMLYGVDSSERASKSHLPAKLRYKPWTGLPMEGSIELEYQGQFITIERSTVSARAPMGQFRAYDTKTGQPISWLTGETCGQTLLGVERSVFERSGFLRQTGLSLSKDASLEQRLGRLVTTGEESVSYIETEQALRALKNHCWHKTTGLLPQARAELERVEATLLQMRQINQALVGLRAEQLDLQHRQTQLQFILQNLQQSDNLAKREKLEQAQQQLEQAQQQAQACAQAAASLPPVSELKQLLSQMDAQQETLQTMALDEAMDAQEPAGCTCPAPFAGLEPEQILPKANADFAAIQQLDASVSAPKTLLWCAIGALVLAIAAIAIVPLAGFGLLAAGLGLLVAVLFQRSRAARVTAQRQAERRHLLDRYGVQTPQEILSLAQDYVQQLTQYRQQLADYTARLDVLRIQRQQAQAALQLTAAAVSRFAPQAQSILSCREAVLEALQLRQQAELAVRDAQRAKQQYDAIYQAVGRLPQTIAPPQQDFSGQYDPQDVARRLESVGAQLAAVSAQVAQGEGKVSALGNPLELAARKEQLQERIAALEQRYDALALALQALGDANNQLQSRFSPQLSQQASQIMAELTGSRYDKVLLNQELDVAARQAGAAVTRDLRTLSCGTGDQLYFAVRLAICRLVLPPDAPIVLDDALVYFDDVRAKQALKLLQREAQTRQILLFTCQDRERRLLES